MWMCVCMCMYVCTCVCTCVQVQVCVYVCACVFGCISWHYGAAHGRREPDFQGGETQRGRWNPFDQTAEGGPNWEEEGKRGDMGKGQSCGQWGRGRQPSITTQTWAAAVLKPTASHASLKTNKKKCVLKAKLMFIFACSPPECSSTWILGIGKFL